MRIIIDFLKVKYLDPIIWFTISIILLIMFNKYASVNYSLSNLYLITGIVCYIVAVIETVKKILKK